MTGHFKCICCKCKKVTAQCRCMDCDKVIYHDICPECLKKAECKHIYLHNNGDVIICMDCKQDVTDLLFEDVDLLDRMVE